MAEKIKVNVVIGGRTYPLFVSSEQEEQGTRRAAETINALIAKFEKNYAVNDKQDVLAMCALQFASKLETTLILNQENEQIASEKITELHRIVDASLK